MKKIFNLILSFVVITTTVFYINKSIIKVEAAHNYNLYPMNCNNYEVDYVNDNGGFDNQGCFSDFSSAINKMKSLGDDAVVRHNASYSPTKIIAMSSGVAYTYPVRSGSNTVNVFQYDGNGGKKTYVTKHRELAYFNTHSYYGNGEGSINVNVTGFTGFINLKNIDLVPMKFIKRNMLINLGGNDITAENEQPFSIYTYHSHYKVVQNGNYKELVFNSYSGWAKQNYPDVSSLTLGPAADFMNVNDTYYSYDGFNFYKDMEYRNFAGTYYNYYQFLPLRTMSKIPADAYNKLLYSLGKNNSRLINQGQTFIDNQNYYGMNAALVFAMACLESGYGTSRFAVEKNNFFGWKAYDQNPNSASTFPSINKGIEEHMSINLRGYTDINDVRFFGMHLGNKGSGLNVLYASDPYWGYKIAAIAYNLDKISNDYNGNLTDYGKYSLGLLNKYNISIYRGNSTSSGELYKSAYGATYQSNFIVPVLYDEGSFYKIRLNNAIRDNGSIVYHKENGNVVPPTQYIWDKSIGYVAKQDLNLLNSVKIENNIGKKSTGDFVFNVSNLVINNNKLQISGISYMPGIYVNNENKAKVKLKIRDEYLDNTKQKEFELNYTVKDNDKIEFNSEVDISELAVGRYFFEVRTEYEKYSVNNYTSTLKDNINIKDNKVLIKDKEYSLIKKYSTTYLIVENKKDNLEPTPTPSITPTPSPTSTPTPDITPTPEITPTPTITPEPTPDIEIIKPTPKPNQVRQSLEKFEYIDDTYTKVNISGIAFIDTINADENSDISHKIIFTNMANNEKVIFDAETSLIDNNININDGFTYTKVKYSSIVDLSKLEKGEYTVKIQVKNGDIIKEKFIIDINKNNIPKDTKISDLTYKFTQKQIYGFRYELSVYSNSIDYSLIKKPTRRDSVIAYNKLEITDKKLILDAVSWIYNINYNDIDKVKYNLVLLPENSNPISYQFNTNKCEIDYTSLLKSKYKYDYTCFNGEADLSNLENGTYLVYLDNFVNEYRDIFELYNISKPEIKEVEIDNKVYKLKFDSIRSRLVLSIEDKK